MNHYICSVTQKLRLGVHRDLINIRRFEPVFAHEMSAVKKDVPKRHLSHVFQAFFSGDDEDAETKPEVAANGNGFHFNVEEGATNNFNF